MCLKYEKSYFSYNSYKGVCKMETAKGKYLFGICKVGEKGQIVIPKEARTVFNIKPGDSLVMLGDEKKGIAIVKAEVFTGVAQDIIDGD